MIDVLVFVNTSEVLDPKDVNFNFVPIVVDRNITERGVVDFKVHVLGLEIFAFPSHVQLFFIRFNAG